MTREDMERIDRLLEGSIAREDFEALQESMRRDPAVLRHYRHQAAIHGRLEWELREATPAAPPAPAAEKAHRPRYLLPALAASAALVAIAFLSHSLLREGDTADPPVADTTPEPTPSVARLLASDARWTDHDRQASDRFIPGRYGLETGAATLVFDTGATLVLQAPADLEITSSRRVQLHAGRATVEIPDQAAGFTFETPSASLADQDTRFSVAVDERGRTELHVFEGMLDLHPKFGDLDPVLVREDRPVSIDPSSTVQALAQPFGSADFPRLPASEKAPSPGFAHWSFDRALSQTANLTLFPDTGRKRSGHPRFPARVRSRNADSTIALVPGRFGNAIRLHGGGGFLSTDLAGVPGHRARTVAFWVRIPPRDGVPYAMVSWGAKGNGSKWQIGWNAGNDNSGVPGAIRTEVQGGFAIGSTDLRDGRWHHVASVFLGGEEALPGTHILHYIDGRLEETSAVLNTPIHTIAEGKGALPVAIGRRLEPDTTDTFKGLIDELYIFPEALSPRQIEALYQENRGLRRR